VHSLLWQAQRTRNALIAVLKQVLFCTRAGLVAAQVLQGARHDSRGSPSPSSKFLCQNDQVHKAYTVHTVHRRTQDSRPYRGCMLASAEAKASSDLCPALFLVPDPAPAPPITPAQPLPRAPVPTPMHTAAPMCPRARVRTVVHWLGGALARRCGVGRMGGMQGWLTDVRWDARAERMGGSQVKGGTRGWARVFVLASVCARLHRLACWPLHLCGPKAQVSSSTAMCLHIQRPLRHLLQARHDLLYCRALRHVIGQAAHGEGGEGLMRCRRVWGYAQMLAPPRHIAHDLRMCIRMCVGALVHVCVDACVLFF